MNAAITHDIATEYASSISTLREVMNVLESAQFLAGDEINRIRAQFTDKTIEGISDDANMSVTSAYEYASMAEFWPSDTRDHYAQCGIRYSHMRLAKRLGTLEKACEFLDRCILNCWSVRYAALELAKLMGESVEPPPLLSIAVTLTYERGRWTITGLDDLDTTKLHMGTLRVTS